MINIKGFKELYQRNISGRVSGRSAFLTSRTLKMNNVFRDIINLLE